MNKIDERAIKLNELSKLIELATEYLAAAERMKKQGGFWRQTIDLGYNAAELCAKALILAKQDTLPRRHSGVVGQWSKLYVVTGEIDKGVGRLLNRSLDYRNLSRYDPKAAIDEGMAEEVVAAAKNLIEISKKLLN